MSTEILELIGICIIAWIVSIAMAAIGFTILTLNNATKPHYDKRWSRKLFVGFAYLLFGLGILGFFGTFIYLGANLANMP